MVRPELDFQIVDSFVVAEAVWFSSLLRRFPFCWCFTLSIFNFDAFDIVDGLPSIAPHSSKSPPAQRPGKTCVLPMYRTELLLPAVRWWAPGHENTLSAALARMLPNLHLTQRCHRHGIPSSPSRHPIRMKCDEKQWNWRSVEEIGWRWRSLDASSRPSWSNLKSPLETTGWESYRRYGYFIHHID